MLVHNTESQARSSGAHWRTQKLLRVVLQIRGYPTLKVIVNGSEFKAFKGARDLDSLTTFIKEAAKEALTETTE